MARDVGQYSLKDVTVLTAGFPLSSIQVGAAVEVEELHRVAQAQRLAGDVVDGIKPPGAHGDGVYGAFVEVHGDRVLNT